MRVSELGVPLSVPLRAKRLPKASPSVSCVGVMLAAPALSSRLESKSVFVTMQEAAAKPGRPFRFHGGEVLAWINGRSGHRGNSEADGYEQEGRSRYYTLSLL